MNTQRITAPQIVAKKAAGEKITCVTAYDYPTAVLADQAGIDMILVGDSLGNAELGYDNTLPVTMDEMRHHARAVLRGAKHALVIGDMPFLSYNASIEEGIRNAGLFIKDGCTAVKLECAPYAYPLIKQLVGMGIPVQGHIGFTPQYVNAFGGYRVQGKTSTAAAQLVEMAMALEDLGVFSIVLELIPRQVAQVITERLSIPTIGIGAGPDCDGQVQVINDLLGLDKTSPRHAKRYVNLYDIILKALGDYQNDVKQGTYPTDENVTSMKDDEYQMFLQNLKK
jgi:3-methyl-2-oxobutanoate hydroxymethyltransferase